MIREPEYKQRVDAWIDAHKDDMIEDLSELIRIPSIEGEPKEGMPFGEMPAKAVLAMQGLMEKYGFRTTNYDNYCVCADLDAEGEKKLDILSHLDVVPVTDFWTKTQPFEPAVIDDRIYGRGSNDDKGPTIAAFYAMRAIKELGLKTRYGVRMICGSNEETSSSDIRHYYGKEKEAQYTFSPDADFPLINVEKGRLSKYFEASGDLRGPDGEGAKNAAPHIVSIHVGIVVNAVPGKGTITISDITEEKLSEAAEKTIAQTGVSFFWTNEGNTFVIEAVGETSHAAFPHNGNNCLTAILTLVKNLDPEPDRGTALLGELLKLWPHGDTEGKALGISCRDEVSEALSISLDILNYETSEDGRTFTLRGAFDCRAPICCNDENLTAKVRRRLEMSGFTMEEGGMVPPHYVSADSELVQKLLDSYELYFGERSEPLVTGGGTYVHSLERGVAFGPSIKGVDNRDHGDDEFMEIPTLLLSAKVYADAIMRLCN